MLTSSQRIALGAVAGSYVGQCVLTYRTYKVNKMLLEHIEHSNDFANRSAYLVMFLVTKCVEAGIEFDEFEQRILADPPKMVDEGAPTLYAELFEQYQATGGDSEAVDALFSKLREIRNADED